jgi:hypothetical protein
MLHISLRYFHKHYWWTHKLKILSLLQANVTKWSRYFICDFLVAQQCNFLKDKTWYISYLFLSLGFLKEIQRWTGRLLRKMYLKNEKYAKADNKIWGVSAKIFHLRKLFFPVFKTQQFLTFFLGAFNKLRKVTITSFIYSCLVVGQFGKWNLVTLKRIHFLS